MVGTASPLSPPSREEEDHIDLEQWFEEGHSSEAAEEKSWEILGGGSSRKEKHQRKDR